MEDLQQANINLDSDDYAKLMQIAEAENTSAEAIIRDLISDFIFDQNTGMFENLQDMIRAMQDFKRQHQDAIFEIDDHPKKLILGFKSQGIRFCIKLANVMNAKTAWAAQFFSKEQKSKFFDSATGRIDFINSDEFLELELDIPSSCSVVK